jgi:hypothetical protein
MVFANLLLVLLTALYVRLTWRTLEALRQASLREREALHLREIKTSVIEPIVSWIQRLSNMLRGGMPDLLTVSSYPGKPWQVSYTIDEPFTARSRLAIPSEPDVPDELASWTSLEEGRLSKFLYEHSKQEHFTEKLRAFDRILDDARQLVAALVSFANECAMALTSAEIPQAVCYEDQNSMSEWVDPYLLAVECINSLLANRKELGIDLEALPNSRQLRTRHRAVARATDPDKLKRWQESGFEHVRKRWERSGLPERTKNLLRNADTVRPGIEQLFFTHSLDVECELVSGRKRRR